jgi:hypothetical protein
MKIVQKYSHLDGEGIMQTIRPGLFSEIVEIIRTIDATSTKTKVAKITGKLLYDPRALSLAFNKAFFARGWKESRYNYYLTLNRELMEKSLLLPAWQQKEFLMKNGEKDPVFRFNQMDFIKDKVAVEIQFGKHASVASDLFVKHVLFNTAGITSVGIEILVTRAMQMEMSTGTAFYEGEVYNLLRQGTGCPSVPLLIFGIEA